MAAQEITHCGVQSFPNCKNILLKIGVFPIADHYCDQHFDIRKPKQPISQDLILPEICWNTSEQLKMIGTVSFPQEITEITQEKSHGLEFYLNNGAFISGDAENWYQLIRLIKPRGKNRF